MDKFTRNYLMILGGIALLILVMVLYESPIVWRLNGQLKDNETLAEYPYRYRVLDFRNGVATLSTPRAANFGAFRALRILYPELADEPDDSPLLYEAQREMARVQALAVEVIKSNPEVSRVAWKLDERWLYNNGIDADLL